jgi:hypothetical protein
MMRDRKDDYSLGLNAVEQREAEAFDNDPAGIAARRRPGMRIGKCARSRYLDRCGEALAQAGLRFIVVDNFG